MMWQLAGCTGGEMEPAFDCVVGSVGIVLSLSSGLQHNAGVGGGVPWVGWLPV